MDDYTQIEIIKQWLDAHTQDVLNYFANNKMKNASQIELVNAMTDINGILCSYAANGVNKIVRVSPTVVSAGLVGLSEDLRRRCENAAIEAENAAERVENLLSNGYMYIGVATPSSTHPVFEDKVFYIARQAGTYTNFGGLTVTEGISILKYDGANWSQDKISYMDGGVFDVTAYSGDEFASLSALLSDNNLINLIPFAVRKGGMSVKFVCSTDHNYLQYKLNTDSFSVNVTDWDSVDVHLAATGIMNKIVKTDDSVLRTIFTSDDIAPGTTIAYKITALASGSQQLAIRGSSGVIRYFGVNSGVSNESTLTLPENYTKITTLHNTHLRIDYIKVIPKSFVDVNTKINQLFAESPVFNLIGNGNSLVNSPLYKVKVGNTYRIWIKNPDVSISGITLTSDIRFAVRPYDANGSRVGNTDLVDVQFSSSNPTSLANYYEFTIQNNTNSVEIKARCAVGETLIAFVEDVTVAKFSATGIMNRIVKPIAAEKIFTSDDIAPGTTIAYKITGITSGEQTLAIYGSNGVIRYFGVTSTNPIESTLVLPDNYTYVSGRVGNNLRIDYIKVIPKSYIGIPASVIALQNDVDGLDKRTTGKIEQFGNLPFKITCSALSYTKQNVGSPFAELYLTDDAYNGLYTADKITSLSFGIWTSYSTTKVIRIVVDILVGHYATSAKFERYIDIDVNNPDAIYKLNSAIWDGESATIGGYIYFKLTEAAFDLLDELVDYVENNGAVDTRYNFIYSGSNNQNSLGFIKTNVTTLATLINPKLKLYIESENIGFVDSTPPAIATADYNISHGSITFPNSITDVTGAESFVPGSTILNIKNDMFIPISNTAINSLLIEGNGHKISFYDKVITDFVLQNGRKTKEVNDLNSNIISCWVDQDFNVHKLSCTEHLQTSNFVYDTEWNKVESESYDGECYVPLPANFDYSRINAENAIVTFTGNYCLFVSINNGTTQEIVTHEIDGVTIPFVKCYVITGYNLNSEYNAIGKYPVVTLYNCYDEEDTLYIDYTNNIIKVPFSVTTLYGRQDNNFAINSQLYINNLNIVGCYNGVGKHLFKIKYGAVALVKKTNVVSSDRFVECLGDTRVKDCVFEDSFGNIIKQPSDELDTVGKITISGSRFHNTNLLSGRLIASVEVKQRWHIHHCDFINFGAPAVIWGCNQNEQFTKSYGCFEYNNVKFDTTFVQVAKLIIPNDGGALYGYTINMLSVIRYNNISNYTSRGSIQCIYFDDGCPNCYVFNNLVVGLKGQYAIGMRRATGRTIPVGFVENVNKYCGYNIVDGNIIVGVAVTDSVSKVENNLILNKQSKFVQTQGFELPHVVLPIIVDGTVENECIVNVPIDISKITFVGSPWVGKNKVIL